MTTVAMCQIRAKVERDRGWLVQSIRGRGYPRRRMLPSAILAVPRQQDRREIRRVTWSLRLRAILRPRVRVGLDRLAVEMPGRVSEHRDDDRKPDEERQRAEHQ